MVEYIQTDIWVRFQRLRGHDVLFVWANDAHGTPIMLKARQEGITPEELIERVGVEQKRDFDDFDISYDNFHTTHSDENREITYEIYRRLLAAGPHPPRDDRAGLRRAGEDVPARPLRARHLPEVRRARPVRRQLRGLRRDLHARRPRSTRLGRERHGPGAARVRAPVLQARRLRADAARVDRRRPAAARRHGQARRVVRRGPARLGHLARRAVFRLRDPRRAGQVLLRLARRADRLPLEPAALLPPHRPRLRPLLEARQRRRGLSLHRQGHRVLPHAVLAGRARRAPVIAHRRPCTRTAS